MESLYELSMEGNIRQTSQPLCPTSRGLVVVVGIVRPLTTDLGLSRLSRQFQNIDGLISIKVHGPLPKAPSVQPIAQ